jgi:hypothetical protein
MDVDPTLSIASPIELNTICYPLKLRLQSGPRGDVFDVADDPAATFLVAQNLRLRVPVDEAGCESSRLDTFAIELTVGDDGVFRLRMKWVRKILGVGLEAEQFPAAFGPGAPLWAGVPVDI